MPPEMKPIDDEAYGMDARPGPSKMPQNYFNAVCPPDMAKAMADHRAKTAKEPPVEEQ